MTGRRLARAVAALLALAATRVGAQASAPRTPALAPELRLDGAFGREGGAFGGVGLFGDAGLYTRLGIVVVGGLARDPLRLGAADDDGVMAPAARIEALARFHLDPLRLSRRGTYLGGGVAAALRDGAAPRWQLVALLGIEGAPRGAIAPAVEVGLGGGVRVAVVLRRARAARR
ncbi:MAG: hypothetical protein ACXW61_18220 [Gemmatirosa sp.]